MFDVLYMSLKTVLISFLLIIGKLGDISTHINDLPYIFIACVYLCLQQTDTLTTYLPYYWIIIPFFITIVYIFSRDFRTRELLYNSYLVAHTSIAHLPLGIYARIALYFIHTAITIYTYVKYSSSGSLFIRVLDNTVLPIIISHVIGFLS